MENMRVSRERTTARCAECGKPVEQKFNAGKQDEEILCFRCQALKAVAQLPSEKSTASAASRMDAKRVKLLLQVFIVVACFAIVAFQMPEVLRALREKPKPVRYGSYDTDPIADQCLENMWRAIKLVQEGKKVPPDLTCRHPEILTKLKPSATKLRYRVPIRKNTDSYESFLKARTRCRSW